ncbi:MAG: hypothetical protein KAX49_13655 [Halanaerobiales bacterium]|nr:hypothetical protein [Halanaerobiales bacterium]
MRLITVFIILLLIMTIGVVVYAEDYGEVMGQRQIVFVQTGEGSLQEINPAIRAFTARQDATKGVFVQYLNWLKNLSFQNKKLSELIEEDLLLRMKVEKNIFFNFNLEETEYPDGRVKIQMIRLWNGTNLSSILDRLYRERAYNFNEDGLGVNSSKEELPGWNHGSENGPSEDLGYTGIIIDTRGLFVKPSMAPKIIDSDKEEVYGTMKADPAFVIEVGIVGYAYTIEEAQVDERVGSNPLVIEAVEATGNARDYAIITLKNAMLIREINKNSDILNRCRIIFIIDE